MTFLASSLLCQADRDSSADFCVDMFWEQKRLVLRWTNSFVYLRFFPENGFLSVCSALESVHEVIQLANVDIHEENLWFGELKRKKN